MNEIDQSFLQLTRQDPLTGEIIPIDANERVERILTHQFAKDIVRSMDPQSLFNIIQEAGINDSYELVLLASAQQVQAFLDLDCWRRDEFDLDSFTEWIELLLQGDDKSFDELMRTMDREALVIWIREQVAIFEWEHDRDVLDTISDPVSSSPDGVYALVFPNDERSGAQIRLLLERVYAYNLEFGMHLFKAVRWELTTDMMEHMYRMRNSRLNDLGFVPFEEAVEVYAWLEPIKWLESARKRLREPIAPARSTVGALPPVDYQLQGIEQRLHARDANTFARALASIGQLVAADEVASQADQILSQFRALANRIHIADLGNSSDQNVARKAVDRAQNHIGIALELLSPDSVEDRARALLNLPLKELHRVGFSAIQNLRTQSQKLVQRGNTTLIDTSPYSLLESEDEEMMRGLSGIRPVMHRGKGTPFSQLRDIQTIATRLGKIAFAELLFFAWLGADRKALASDESITNGSETITFRTLFATLVFRAMMEPSEPSLDPLTTKQVNDVLREVAAAQHPFDRVLTAAQSVVNDLSPEDNELAGFARAFVEEQATWLAVTLEDIGETATHEQALALVLITAE